MLTKHGHALAAYVLIILGVAHWDALSRIVKEERAEVIRLEKLARRFADEERAAAAETAPEDY